MLNEFEFKMPEGIYIDIYGIFVNGTITNEDIKYVDIYINDEKSRSFYKCFEPITLMALDDWYHFSEKDIIKIIVSSKNDVSITIRILHNTIYLSRNLSY